MVCHRDGRAAFFGGGRRFGKAGLNGEGEWPAPLPFRETWCIAGFSLERLNVGCLPAFGSFDYVELDGLTFLEAFEAVRVYGGVVNEDVFAILTADETKSLCIVKPLHCSLFHVDVFLKALNLPLDSNRGFNRPSLQKTNLFLTMCRG